MFNATIVAVLVPNSRQIIGDTDRAVANSEIANPTANIIWFDADRINQGVVLWAVPGAGWVITTQVGGSLVVLHAREDGSPTKGNHLNRVEVGFARPTLDDHWQAMSACLARK